MTWVPSSSWTSTLHRVGVVDERPRDELDELGCGHRSAYRAGRMPTWRNRRSTVSEGWAPWLSQRLAFSASTLISHGLLPRVVVTEGVERAAVAGAAAVGDDEAIGRLLRRADAGETDADHG